MQRLILLLALPALAHDLYVMPSLFRVIPGSTVQVALHNGDDFPVSQAAPRLERLMEPRLISASGSTPLTKLRLDGLVTRAEGIVKTNGTAILAVNTKPNLIKLEASKFLSYLKHEGLNHVIEWRVKNQATTLPGRERYSKYVKSLIVAGQPSEFYRHAVGFPIEIVPQADPAAVHAGGQLPVQVLFRGKPAGDLQLEMAWRTVEGQVTKQVTGRTDREGRLTIPVAASGTWKLHTVMMERAEDPDFDWESFWASLTFEIR